MYSGMEYVNDSDCWLLNSSSAITTQFWKEYAADNAILNFDSNN